MVSTAGKLGTGAEFTTETWYGGERRYRSENSSPDGSLFGQVVNGDEVWIYQTFDGVTRAAHGPANTLGKGFAGESLAGQQSLPDVLAQYSGSCQSANQTGEDTFAGTSVYVIVLTTDLAQCESDQDGIKARVLEGSSLNLWVDKETFLALQTSIMNRTAECLSDRRQPSSRYRPIRRIQYSLTSRPAVRLLSK
jgi:outer membrane lipoprotein-sorting protein